MNVTVKLFAGHRERVGSSEIAVDLPEGSTVEDAFGLMVRTYPTLGEMESFTTFARNQQVVRPETLLNEGDELALLQPMSGGRTMIEILGESLSLDHCVSAVARPDCGAIVTFLGTVRDNVEGTRTDHLEYEAYREMAEEVIGQIVGEAQNRWPTGDVAVQHRVGTLAVGEISVAIAISAPHRGEAFEACHYVIDNLKARAPIWKKEFGDEGEYWVGGPTG